MLNKFSPHTLYLSGTCGIIARTFLLPTAEATVHRAQRSKSNPSRNIGTRTLNKTVETFDPKQTTTLETPAKTLAAEAKASDGTIQGNRIGFVSLGCPKNLVDSERILTQLRIDGYEVTNSYDNADLVIVNTCGFIDAAVEESLDAVREALEENGKVIVTGCLGAKENQIREVHPDVLEKIGRAHV